MRNVAFDMLTNMYPLEQESRSMEGICQCQSKGIVNDKILNK